MKSFKQSTPEPSAAPVGRPHAADGGDFFHDEIRAAIAKAEGRNL